MPHKNLSNVTSFLIQLPQIITSAVFFLMILFSFPKYLMRVTHSFHRFFKDVFQFFDSLKIEWHSLFSHILLFFTEKAELLLKSLELLLKSSAINDKMNREAWYAAVHGVAKNQTRLKHRFPSVQFRVTELNWTEGPRRWLNGKESACQCRRCSLDPWVRKIPGRRKWQFTPVFFPSKHHGQRSPTGSNFTNCKRIGHNLKTKQQQQ